MAQAERQKALERHLFKAHVGQTVEDFRSAALFRSPHEAALALVAMTTLLAKRYEMALSDAFNERESDIQHDPKIQDLPEDKKTVIKRSIGLAKEALGIR